MNTKEIEKNLKNQICSLGQAKELKHIGVPQISLVFYDENGGLYLYNEIAADNKKILYSAFNSSELGFLLPFSLDINEKTLVASVRDISDTATYPEKDGWRFPTETEISFGAVLTIEGDEDRYVLSYRAGHCSIGHKTKDSYKSLLIFDENEAIGRANLLLQLIQYEYLSFRNKA